MPVPAVAMARAWLRRARGDGAAPEADAARPSDFVPAGAIGIPAVGVVAGSPSLFDDEGLWYVGFESRVRGAARTHTGMPFGLQLAQ